MLNLTFMEAVLLTLIKKSVFFYIENHSVFSKLLRRMELGDCSVNLTHSEFADTSVIPDIQGEERIERLKNE